MKAVVSSLDATQPIDARLEQIIEAATTRLQNGEPMDLDELAAAHPEYADQVRELLPAVEMLVRLGNTRIDSPTLMPGTFGHASVPPREQLGDFRIVREIGRGGMGVVYEAEQLSMGRRVALKVLAFAALVQEKSLQRFRNEVRAAAALDHSNIVSVYSLGEERGVHFYAMQLVRGQTLADFINQLCDAQRSMQQSTKRGDEAQISTVVDASHAPQFYCKAARLGIQAAEALQHAHDQGVLHRDIKPSNLLLDAEGKLHVADFGLARIGADIGMTMSGDIIGTLRYMAPEQALAKRVVIDHRADIYSLGATLYELFTLQPPFDETDRAKLLSQIALEEPRPLRKLDRRIPPELETIILKAMAKSADERYQAAQLLANDLQAFLENRPIKARPPAWSDRAWKWSLRHRGLTRMAALALVLLTGVLAVSTAAVKRAQTRAVAALEETSAMLYDSDMAVAYQFFERGSSDEVQTILDRYRPTPGGVDRRGFEWRLLQKLAQQPTPVTLEGHAGSVNELAVFPDRRRLASVGDDGTLRIWDVRNRQLVQTIKLCEQGLFSVAVSPNGRYVAAGNAVVYLCDLKHGNRVKGILHSEYTVESLAFSNDGERLAAGSRYEEVRLISLDGRTIRRIPCNSRVESLEFVAGSPLLLVPNRRPLADRRSPLGIVELWRNDLSTLESELDGSRIDRPGQISIARSSPGGRFIAAGERYKSRAYLFQRESGRVLAETPVSRDRLTDLAYSPDGKAIAIGYRNGCVECFSLDFDRAGNPSLNVRPRIINAHRGEVQALRFIESKTLATCGTDGLIRIWDLSVGMAVGLDLSDLRMGGVQLSPDGLRLLCHCDNELLVFNIKNGKTLFRRSHPNYGACDPAWSPTSDKIAAGGRDRSLVDVLDLSGDVVYSISHKPFPNAFAFSPDGSKIAIIGEERLQLCCSKDGRERLHQSLPGPGTALAFSHDGQRLVYSGQWGAIFVVDAEAMRRLPDFECRSDVDCMAFSPDDSLLATGHGDGVIRIWDMKNAQLQAELVGHERYVTDVAFSPDGRTLLSAANDGSVRAWSVARGRSFGIICRLFAPGTDAARCRISLSADGRRLAVAHQTSAESGPDVLLWQLDPIN